MSKRILERYRRDENGQLIIDISATRVADLYDDFDKQAPYIMKELDYDLVEYLIDSAREIRGEPFSVHFSFSEPVPCDLKNRLHRSIRNYFIYLMESGRRDILNIIRSSFILLAIGLVILAFITYISLAHDLEDSVLEGVLAEGGMIASWVAVWEGIAALLMNAPSFLKDRRIYRRLSEAELHFTLVQ